MPPFTYKPVDKAYYEREIRDFLPEHVIDAHAHVYSPVLRNRGDAVNPSGRSQSWPSLVAAYNPIDDLVDTYRMLFPDQEVTPVIFGMPTLEYDVNKSNEHISEIARRIGCPALLLARPEQTADELDATFTRGGFQGVKVYLEYAPSYIPAQEVRIFDFAPHYQLEVMNARESALMLHIPRPGRLKDPVNMAQLLEIDRQYPKIKLIVAHVGRAYAMEDVGDALDVLKESRMMFDFSANTNQQVFEETLQKVGARRILFGSDLPITRMRMKRVVENGCYINVIQKGAYGDVSDDPHMREIEGAEADALSLFLYEEIAAMRRACEKVGISRADVNALFFDNAADIFHVK